jgi:hypothetical protein
VSVHYCYAPVIMSVRMSEQYVHVRSTDIGTPMSTAYCSAACSATLAPLCVRVGNEAVASAVGAISKCVYANIRK